jgi:hypothetical protein
MSSARDSTASPSAPATRSELATASAARVLQYVIDAGVTAPLPASGLRW